MKLIKRNIRAIVLVVLLMLSSLVGYGAYSLINFGNRWFSSAANVYARRQKSDVIPGRIYDRGGALLASSDETGKRYYHKTGRSGLPWCMRWGTAPTTWPMGWSPSWPSTCMASMTTI